MSQLDNRCSLARLKNAILYFPILHDLGRTSKNLVTSANAGSDLVILRLRVTEAVKLRLGDKSVNESTSSHLWDRTRGHTSEAIRDPPNQTAYRCRLWLITSTSTPEDFLHRV